MEIYPNAYYNYLKNKKADYYAQKEHICEQIEEIYHENDGVFGHRTVREMLKLKGIYISKV